MKTTRRDFLKGLLATGATLAVAPHLLVELVHGASDLTPQERDVAAEVMGLRTRQWRGAELWHPKTMRRTTWADGAIMRDRIDSQELVHGDWVMFADAKTELFIDGEWQTVGALAKEREILYGVPGGAMPAGVINSGQTTEMEIYAKFTEEETAWKRVQVPVLLPGDDLISMIEFDVSDREPLTNRRVTDAFVRLCAEREVSKRYPYAARYLRELQNEYDNESKII